MNSDSLPVSHWPLTDDDTWPRTHISARLSLSLSLSCHRAGPGLPRPRPVLSVSGEPPSREQRADADTESRHAVKNVRRAQCESLVDQLDRGILPNELLWTFYVDSKVKVMTLWELRICQNGFCSKFCDFNMGHCCHFGWPNRRASTFSWRYY